MKQMQWEWGQVLFVYISIVQVLLHHEMYCKDQSLHTKITEVREYSVMKIRIRMYQEHSITNMIVISYAFNAVSDMGDVVL